MSDVVLVEFGVLSAEQRDMVDLHILRAVGSEPPSSASGGLVVEFWVPDGVTPDEVYDDVRGWAIGNGLPVRGVVDA